MKKLLIPLILLLLIGLTGCSNISIGSVQNNTSHKMSASYFLYSGMKKKELTVKDGETVEIAIKITTKKGKIDAFIYDENGEYLYKGEDIQEEASSVTLTEPGDYTIEVDADNHRGSFSFTW